MTKLVNTATAAKSMPDESGASEPDAPESTGKRKQVSKRAFLANGNEVDKIEEANQARYTLLGATGGEKHIDSPVLGTAGNFATMCAIFGFHTKIGNVANTVLNDKEEPGSPDDAATAIAEFISKAQAGTWAERSEGGPGARIDKNALAGAIVEVLAQRGKTVQLDVVLQELEEGRAATADRPAMTAAVLTRAARQDPDVAAAYATRVGKATKSVNDLF